MGRIIAGLEMANVKDTLPGEYFETRHGEENYHSLNMSANQWCESLHLKGFPCTSFLPQVNPAQGHAQVVNILPTVQP